MGITVAEKKLMGGFPRGLVGKTLPSNAEEVLDLIPGQG